MDLATYYNRFCESWSHVEVNLKEATANKYNITLNLVAEKYFDDGIFVTITVYASGTLHVFFTLDKIDKTLEVYNLINDFNENNSWLKVYITTINGNDYLEIKYTNVCGDDLENAIDATQHAFDSLLDESVLKYLKPLTDLTRQ